MPSMRMILNPNEFEHISYGNGALEDAKHMNHISSAEKYPINSPKKTGGRGGICSFCGLYGRVFSWSLRGKP